MTISLNNKSKSDNNNSDNKSKSDNNNNNKNYLTLSKKCFRKSGKKLPSNMHWQQILEELPENMYEPSYKSAINQLLIVGFSAVLAISVLVYAPWFVMPIGWLLLGVVMNGFLAIGKDCSEHMWVPSDILNDIVGVIASVPLINLQLHRRQSIRKLSAKGEISNDEINKKIDNKAMKNLNVWPLFVTLVTFSVSIYQLYTFGGLSALMKWWLLPYVAFLFWRLLGSMMKNTGENNNDGFIPTIRYTFPTAFKWLNIIFQYMNFTIPDIDDLHYVPSYRLRKVYNYIKNDDKWSPYITEGIVSLTTLKELCTNFMNNIKFWITERLNWLNITILFGTPILGLFGFLTTEIHLKTLIWSIIYYFWTGMGITAAYHRLWSHRSFKVVWPVELLLAIFGAGSVQGSIKWWCRNHRIHHRYTDTDYDPYNAQNGFWFAHMGWMLIKPEKKNWAYVDIHDLRQNWIVQWQHKFYLPLVIIMGVIFPTLVAGIGWGDYRGGYFYAGIIRLIFVHHATFCVNSVAHYFGEHTYDDNNTPKDHIVTALLTLGEGYHNFHHEFPFDYRNGIRFFDYDPTKWLINFMWYLGVAYDLKTFPYNEIQKGKINMKQKKLDEEKRHIEWPIDPNDLPALTMQQVTKRVKNGENLVIVNGLVHDVDHFIPDHPGGEKLIRSYIGKDATDAFEGGVYRHHAAAQNLLSTFRIARLEGGNNKKTN